VILLEFMEPWCPHCQKLVPVLENLYKQYGSANVVLLAVSGPWQGATANDAATFIRNYGSSWTYVYDSSGSVFSSYGVNSTPTFFIIGKDGSIAATYNGEQTYDTLASALASASAS
jgi:cytochrome c-type biogenesis protein